MLVSDNRMKLILKVGKIVFELLPILRPILRKFKPYFVKPSFVGWGMTTEHSVPWEDEPYFQEILKQTKKLEYTPEMKMSVKQLDEYSWRLWNCVFAGRISPKNSIFVECGTADGLSAFVILKESDRETHLYDTFSSLKKQDLKLTPTAKVYSGLNIERTKRNLKEFQNTTYHQGYIPETLNDSAPGSIGLLHLDLTSPDGYVSALEFFFPKIIKGGIIIFDDFGWNGYQQAKQKMTAYLESKKGELLKLPTGQAIFFVK